MNHDNEQFTKINEAIKKLVEQHIKHEGYQKKYRMLLSRDESMISEFFTELKQSINEVVEDACVDILEYIDTYFDNLEL